MYQLLHAGKFKSKYKRFLRKHPELEQNIHNTLALLASNPFSPSLKMHKLSGELKSEWAISLTYEYRIIFKLEGNKIYLTNIGTHDEVY